jgi:hypothetical protein
VLKAASPHHVHCNRASLKVPLRASKYDTPWSVRRAAVMAMQSSPVQKMPNAATVTHRPADTGLALSQVVIGKALVKCALSLLTRVPTAASSP